MIPYYGDILSERPTVANPQLELAWLRWASVAYVRDHVEVEISDPRPKVGEVIGGGEEFTFDVTVRNGVRGSRPNRPDIYVALRRTLLHVWVEDPTVAQLKASSVQGWHLCDEKGHTGSGRVPVYDSYVDGLWTFPGGYEGWLLDPLEAMTAKDVVGWAPVRAGDAQTKIRAEVTADIAWQYFFYGGHRSEPTSKAVYVRE